MRLLFFGDLAATGFGTVTADLGRALLDGGVDVRFVSQNEVGELSEPFNSRALSIATYATSLEGILDLNVATKALLRGETTELTLSNGDQWGDWRAEAVLVVADFYGARLMLGPYLEELTTIPTFHYVPIEGHELPPLWVDFWRIVAPIAMSRFGQAEIAKIMGYQPPLMYHGVDTDDFYPVSPSRPIKITEGVVLTSKERCKAFFRIHPAMKVLLRCDRNMPRKGYPSLLRSLTPVLEAHPDVCLALKTQNADQGGVLAEVVSKLPAGVADRVVIMDMQLPRLGLLALYNAADVYVSNSSEGFGLTIAEALACGVPAVGIDYSAVTEVIGPAGTVVPVGMTWDNGYGHFWALADEAEFGRAVSYLLDHPAKAREIGSTGPRHVAANFSWNEAANVMIGVLNERLSTHTEPVMVAA